MAVTKPDFNIFLKPILSDLKLLEIGRLFKITNNLRKILKFFLISGVFDKPARTSVLNIKASNGYYGCLKCLQAGKTVEHVHVYEFNESDPSGPLRNKQTYENDCLNGTNGVMGKTCLSELRFFSPFYNTNIDYMHSVLEGVVKRFFKYWFDMPGPQSIKMFTIEIDRRLLNIKPPSFIPITPRSIEQRNKWRANEFLDFLLYYSLPVFHGIMEPEYLLNLMKLVVSMECLLDKKIKQNDLVIVRQILIQFVSEVTLLYPKDVMVSGMHELLHLVDCTIEFGPLNCINSFQFEELNRKIIRLIHGKDLIGDEFLNLFGILQALMCFTYSNKNPTLIEYFEKHNVIKSSNKKRLTIRKGVCKPLGERFTPSLEIKNLIFSFFQDTLESFQLSYKFNYNGIIYTSVISETKRCDYCVKISDKIFGLVECFVFYKEKVYVVLKKITKLFEPFFDPAYPQLKSKILLCRLTEETVVTTIDKIVKVFLIKISDKEFYISILSISHLFM